MEPGSRIEVATREELVYLLCQASELEHGLLLEYLFAMYSLTRHEDEGISADQLGAINRWERVIASVAAQEMLHLAIVSNLLTALGAAPHFERPNYPHPARCYPGGIQLALVPVGEQALRHFLYLERPEGMELEDAEGFAVLNEALPISDPDTVVPYHQEYKTVGQLYRGIERGFARLVERYGEERLFLGTPRAQIAGSAFRWPELAPVTTLVGVHHLIDTVVEQGEGARGDCREAHFGRFHRVLEELRAAREADPGFEPSRPDRG